MYVLRILACQAQPKQSFIVKRAYKYTFYKLYRFYEAAPSRWMSDWKASVSLMALEIWTLLSLVNYISVYTRKGFSDNFFLSLFIPFLIFSTIHKFFTFEHRNRWRIYVNKFSRIPKKENSTGTYIVWICICLLIGNLIFSFYLLSKVDWIK